MAKKRITPQMLADSLEREAEVKLERVEYEKDDFGNYVHDGPFGPKKIIPARMHYNRPVRLSEALLYPPADIKATRVKLGRTQREQAKDFNVSLRAYQAWESGDALPSSCHRATLRRLQAAAEAMPILTPAMIRELREAYGYTIRQFADLMVTSPSTILRWEAGKVRPRPDVVRRIVDDWIHNK